MTSQEVLAELQSYRLTICRIKALEEEINEYRLLAISTGDSIGDGMPHGSGNGDAPFIKSVNRVVDATQEQTDEINRLKSELYKVTQIISYAPTRRGRDVLELRYRYGWTTKKIAQEWGRSDRNIRAIQSRAIDEIAKKM